MWFMGWPRVNNKQTNQVISNVTLMRNTLAHIFGLWKLAIKLHCILVGTIFWRTQKTICFLLNSRVSVFLWGLHSSFCKTRPERTAGWSFLKTVFVLLTVSLRLDATQKPEPLEVSRSWHCISNPCLLGHWKIMIFTFPFWTQELTLQRWKQQCVLSFPTLQDQHASPT